MNSSEVHGVRATATTWFVAVVVLVTVGVALQQQYRARHAVLFNDFDRWMIMTPGFFSEPGRYVNDLLPTPPVSLLVLRPFSMLPRPASQFLWVCLKLPFAALVLWLCSGMVRRAGARWSPQALALILACWWLPIVVDMQEGQVNFLALLPLVAGLYVAQGERAGSDVAAGLLIALGAAMKVTPVVFIAYFAWKRRWRIAGAGVAGLIAWSLLPAMFFGWGQTLSWLQQWAAVMIVPYAVTGKVVYSTTQSVGSFALRLLTTQPAFEIHRADVFEYGHMHLMELTLPQAQAVVRVIMLAAGVAGLAWSRHALPTLRSQRYVLEVGAVAAFMLWFSERTWVHHYISFVLTLSAAGLVMSDPAVAEARRVWLKRLLILFAGASFFASDAGRVFGPHGVEWAKAVGVFLWPSVLVTLATLGFAAQERAVDAGDRYVFSPGVNARLATGR